MKTSNIVFFVQKVKRNVSLIKSFVLTGTGKSFFLAQTVGQIKRSNEDSAQQQMKEIKKLKFDEPHKFKKKANEDQFNFNRKLLVPPSLPRRMVS